MRIFDIEGPREPWVGQTLGVKISSIGCAVVLSGFSACGGAESEPLVEGDVLLIVIDTLRADVLSSYGYAMPTSPNLDALAGDGIRFAEALTQAPNTATSHATLFTGLSPWTHRVANLTSLEMGTAGLPPAFTTIAERFGAHGYRTAAFTDGGPLGKAWNLMQGFDHLEAEFEGVEAKVDQMEAWLKDPEGASRTAPNFVFLHTYQVHEPYLPPLEFAARFNSNPGYNGPVLDSERRARELRDGGGELEPNGKILYEHKADFTAADVQYLFDLYTAELAYTDAQLGRLFDVLKQEGRFDDMTIIVTSDHGEEFGEHGEFGHNQLYRETLHVPLIVRFPKGQAGPWSDFQGAVVEQRVSQVDVHATLVELMGGTWEVDTGRSFFQDMRDGVFTERTSYSETTEGIYGQLAGWGDLRFQRAVRAGDFVMLESELGGAITRELDKAGAPVVPLQVAPSPLLRELPGGVMEGELSQLIFLRQLGGRVERHLVAAEELRMGLLEGESATFTSAVDGQTQAELEALGYVE
jgi:arylsulfatase A-like enzyme